MQDISRERILTSVVLNALDRFGPALSDAIYLIVPPILHVYDNHLTPIRTKLALLTFLRRLVLNCDLSTTLSRIIYPLHRTLCDESSPVELKEAVVATLKVMSDAYACDIRPFINLIR